MRIRLSEEIIAHGLEGTVLVADPNTLAIIVEGEKPRIKIFHSDISSFIPDTIEVTQLYYSMARATRKSRIKKPEKSCMDNTIEYLLQNLSEIERKVTRMDQKISKLISLVEGGASIDSYTKDPDSEGEDMDDKDPPMEINSEATNGFAAMFGNM